MALKWLGATHRGKLGAMATQDVRFYLGFRDREYPPIGDSFTWTAIGSGDNQAGSHLLTGGTGSFLIPLQDKMTIALRFKPNFAYDVAAIQYLYGWYADATHYLLLMYNPDVDRFIVGWIDGGTARYAYSDALGTGEVLDVWFDLAVSLDLTTGDTTGVSLNLRSGAGAWSEMDTSWSDTADSKTTNMQLFLLSRILGAAGDYDFDYVRIFSGKQCTAAEIAAGFETVKEEEIYFPLNGCAIGWDRCNITRHVMYYSLSKGCEKYDGPGSNEMRIDLKSEAAQFADDQYAAFAPLTDAFNGTAAQQYLQNRSRVFVDTWDANVFQPVFTGRVTPAGYVRSTPSASAGYQTVRIECEDQVSELARNFDEVAHTYDGKAICDATEADSLVHAIARIGTQKAIKNYASNSSFENATIANSWAVAGVDGTFTRQAGGLTGSYQGDLVCDAAAVSVTQTITFTGTKRLNVGETYTFVIFLKSAAACGDDIKLAENDAVGENDSTTAAYVIAGGEGWKMYSVTHTITDKISSRLLISVELDDTETMSLDDAFLLEGAEVPYWIVLNNNDGASAVESADDADEDSYDTCGFDCDLVADTLVWVLIQENKPIWEDLKDLGVAALAEYIGFDSAGTFVMRSYLKTGYADPTPILTIATARGMSASLDIERANWIVVEGRKVKKGTKVSSLWDIENSKLFAEGKEKMRVEMADAAIFPDPTEYDDVLWVRIF